MHRKKKSYKILSNMLNRIAAVIIAAMFFAISTASFCTFAKETGFAAYTEEELEYVKKSHALKVGYVRDRKPVSFHGADGEFLGISRSIFDRIAELSGLTFEYAELPAGDVTYEYLLKEGYDLVTGVEYNKENQAARGILISNPYLSSRKVIVARDNLNYMSDAEFTVAISTGSQTIKKVFAEQYPNFKLEGYPTIEACFDAVDSGAADLLIQNQYVAEYWLYKPRYDNLKVIPIMELDDQLCFSAVVPLEKEDNETWHEKEILISIINKAIARISDKEAAGYIIAATTANMYKYTFFDAIYQYRYTLIVLCIAAILICVLLYININMRIRSINDRADAKAKGAFLSTMSHEIRTPLNGLISLNYLMSQHLDDREKMEGYLKQSSLVADYLLSLVNNILDMSRLQENKIELEQSPVNLSVLFDTVEIIEKGGMEDKGINFSMDIELEYPAIVGDGIRIQQILVNIIDNARKYTDKNGSVFVMVRQEKVTDGRIMTKVEIADTGRGMSEEFQKKIFDPFTQERATVSQGNEGTGLGMAICSLLAKRMGGDLSVESRLGEGSRFMFVFVSEPLMQEIKDTELTENQEMGVSSGKPKILIVEDNEFNGQILLDVLEGEGFEVLHVLNGKEALKTFRASEIDEYGVILMDLMMPEMDGFEAARSIRALERPDAGRVKIFACTANSFKEDRDKAFESGMNDFITKPLNVDELLKKLLL